MIPLRFILPILLTLILAALLPAPAQGEVIQKDIHQTYPVSKGATLHLRHGDGDVDLRSWNKDVLDIKVRYHIEYKKMGIGSKPDFDVKFKQRGDDIFVTGQEKGATIIGSFSRKRHDYTYTIRAPAYLQVDLVGDDGDVAIDDWRGNITCTLDDGSICLHDIEAAETRIDIEDGDLTVTGLAGELVVNSEDGDLDLSDCRTTRCILENEDGNIEIEDATGDFRIEVEDGDVRLQNVRAGSVEVSAEDGDIRLALLKQDDLDLEAETSDGDLTVLLEPGFSFAFNVATADGRIDVDRPGADRVIDGNHTVAGTLGDGGGRIRLRASDGRVTLALK